MPGTLLTCADNSGGKILEIISVKGYKGTRRTKPKAGVASFINVRIYRGNEKVRKQVHKAIIIRQKKEYRRPDGTRIEFEDNAAVLVDEKGEPKGTIIMPTKLIRMRTTNAIISSTTIVASQTICRLRSVQELSFSRR